jgi:hypothetical protein
MLSARFGFFVRCSGKNFVRAIPNESPAKLVMSVAAPVTTEKIPKSATPKWRAMKTPWRNTIKREKTAPEIE